MYSKTKGIALQPHVAICHNSKAIIYKPNCDGFDVGSGDNWIVGKVGLELSNTYFLMLC